MRIFDSNNPLLVAVVGITTSVVNIQNNAQGTPVSMAALVGGAHITAFNPSGQTVNTINIAWPSFTFSGVVATDTLSVNGVTYTAVASGATGAQFNVGGSDVATAANFIAVFNAAQSTGTGAMWTDQGHAKVEYQATVDGSGSVTANVQINVSLDGRNMFAHPTLSAFALSGTAHAQGISQEVDAYPFFQAVISGVTPAGARVVVSYRPTRFI
jgi:hypothetical protein